MKSSCAGLLVVTGFLPTRHRRSVLQVESIWDSYLDYRFDWSKRLVDRGVSHSGKPAILPQTDGSKQRPQAFAPANLPPTDLLASLRIVLLLVLTRAGTPVP